MEKKNTLDLAGITAKCDYLINATLPYYQQFSEAFVVLKLTGCRVSELFEIERWSWLGDEIYSFQPQKGNTVRTVQLNSECADFQHAVRNQIKPFGGLSKYQLYNVYDRVKGWDLLMSGDKDISLYVFRYRFAKQLYADGYDVFTIASMMGYTNVATVQSYLIATVSEVFSKPPIGFVDIGGIWISQDNFAITDDGAGIYDFRGTQNLWMGRHYTVDAILRVLDWLGVYRLPTREEYAVIADYCARLYGYPAACLSNDAAKWASVNYFMLNAFELDLGGAGRYANYALSFYRSRGYYLCYDSQSATVKTLYVHSSSSVFNYVNYLVSSACSVRVVIA